MASRDDRLRQLIVEQAAEWHIAQADGPLDAVQAREFTCWLRASPRHIAEYLAIAELDRDLAAVARADCVEIATLLRRTDVGVRQLPTSRAAATIGATRRTPRRGRWGRWLAAAASLVLIVGIAAAGWRMFHAGDSSETIATQRGQTMSTRLPDGTRVKIDAQSIVRVRFSQRQRSISLVRGQAYFEVARDSRPFAVAIGSLVVRDIGTAFNIDRRTNQATVTVTRGQVAVYPSAQSSPSPTGGGAEPSRTDDKPLAAVRAGQQLRISNDGRVLSIANANLWQALAWTDGRITFDATPIAEVVSNFNRHNEIQIAVRSPSLNAMQISGTFNAADIPAFIAFLQTLPGVHIHRRGRRIQVYVQPRATSR